MKLRTILIAGSATLALAAPALADDASIEKRLDAMQRMIDSQQKQIESQRGEIKTLKHTLSRRRVKLAPEVQTAAAAPPAPSPAPVPEGRTGPSEQEQIDALNTRIEATENSAKIAKQDAPVWSLANGRPSVTSADGRFSAAIRAIAQYDTAYYMQSGSARQLAPANGPDLSSGANFRRVQLGLQGKLFGDWSYFFNYDFAGSGGTETPGHIQAVYVEYDGFAPFAVRLGAFPPSAGLEDSTGSADTIFLERNSPSDVARNIAGGDGRDAASVIYAGDRIYGAVSLSGDKIQDSGAFDEQEALLGRLSGLLYTDDDAKLVLSGNGTYVFKTPDTSPLPDSPGTITLSDPPELTVDNSGTKLVSTGALNGGHVWEWGMEGAAQWDSLYAQAGYFGYGVDLRASPLSYNFDGWYAQATWVLTGESRVYSTASGAFGNPHPRDNFSLSGGGWGAWELAARYSDLDLNDHAGTIGAAQPADGLRGGDQKIWTFGLNWYPNAALKFDLQYQNVDVGRIGTIPAGFGHGTLSNAQVGQRYNTIALRSQIAF
ncbi:MAG TPA: porin [Rhizomicrobium sp.]|jgi:phosphate-selective porin OprO/OprP